MPIKPRANFQRSGRPKPIPKNYFPIGDFEFEIGAWCPDPEAKQPPEQVHFVLHISGLDMPLVTRFKSPDTLGFLIEELTRYRALVWSDAEPVDCSGKFGEE